MIGIIPLSGFWAKDEVLTATDHAQSIGVYLVLLASLVDHRHVHDAALHPHLPRRAEGPSRLRPRPRGRAADVGPADPAGHPGVDRRLRRVPRRRQGARLPRRLRRVRLPRGAREVQVPRRHRAHLDRAGRRRRGHRLLRLANGAQIADPRAPDVLARSRRLLAQPLLHRRHLPVGASTTSSSASAGSSPGSTATS